ncbi:MAG: helix-turn-helix transcriptional regulator [Saprospiraceae bacterium]|nr:helix-turn-helix transcriptional regulator [Saprospiraceae bacterium]
MILYIKNMVCRRCILSVAQVLEKNGLAALQISLGEVSLPGVLSTDQVTSLRADLEAVGFELLDDQRGQLLEKVKTLLIEKVQSGELPEEFSLVKYITQAIPRDYSAVSKLFSEVEGLSLEKYFILQKIEKVKEWLAYNELSLAEIAYRLGYSSPAYLSNQFKKITGLTPSAFKTNHAGRRQALDELNIQ